MVKYYRETKYQYLNMVSRAAGIMKIACKDNDQAISASECCVNEMISMYGWRHAYELLSENCKPTPTEEAFMVGLGGQCMSNNCK